MNSLCEQNRKTNENQLCSLQRTRRLGKKAKDCFIAAVARCIRCLSSVPSMVGKCVVAALSGCTAVGLRAPTGVNHKMIWRFLWMMKMFNNISYFNAHELRGKMNAWRCMASARLIYWREKKNTTWMWHNVNANRFFNLRIVVWSDGAMPSQSHTRSMCRDPAIIWMTLTSVVLYQVEVGMPSTRAYMRVAQTQWRNCTCYSLTRRLNTTISMRSHFVPHRFAFFSILHKLTVLRCCGHVHSPIHFHKTQHVVVQQFLHRKRKHSLWPAISATYLMRMTQWHDVEWYRRLWSPFHWVNNNNNHESHSAEIKTNKNPSENDVIIKTTRFTYR